MTLVTPLGVFQEPKGVCSICNTDIAKCKWVDRVSYIHVFFIHTCIFVQVQSGTYKYFRYLYFTHLRNMAPEIPTKYLVSFQDPINEQGTEMHEFLPGSSVAVLMRPALGTSRGREKWGEGANELGRVNE